MSDRVSELLEQILQLSPSERELLDEALFQHSQPLMELNDSMRAELEQRVRSVVDGTAELFDSDAVMAEADERIARGGRRS